MQPWHWSLAEYHWKGSNGFEPRLGKERAGTRLGTRASQPRGCVRHDAGAARCARIHGKDLKGKGDVLKGGTATRSANHGLMDHSGLYPGICPKARRKSIAERRNWRKVFTATCLVSVLAFTAAFGVLCADRSGAGDRASISSQALDAVNYLVQNYNNDTRQTGLIHESPDTGSPPQYNDQNMTYWVYNDNFLASLALKASNPGMAANISRNMTHYLDLKGIADPSKHLSFFMALTEPFMWDWRASRPFNLTPDGEAGYKIFTEVHDQGVFSDYKLYADIALLKAINESLWGDPVKANDNYSAAEALWDGHGFSDKGNGYAHDNYQTYKVALYIYESKLLGKVDSVNYTNATKALTLMQIHGGVVPETNGGFSTWYSWPDSSPDPLARGSTNVETTSLAILALDLPTTVIPEFGPNLVPIILMLATVILISRKRQMV